MPSPAAEIAAGLIGLALGLVGPTVAGVMLVLPARELAETRVRSVAALQAALVSTQAAARVAEDAVALYLDAERRCADVHGARDLACVCFDPLVP